MSMSHLTDIEIADFVEDVLPASRAAHLETCESCREKAFDARDALSRAAEADIPEPSPLFWDHFSERIQQELRDDGTRVSRRSGWRRWTEHSGLRWALSGALVTALLAGAAWRVTAPTLRRDFAVPPSAQSTTDPARAGDDDRLNADADPAWAVVRTVADEVPWSDSIEAGLSPRPDVTERAARTLTSDERSELLRLLELETRH